MTESGNPLENPHAERINKTIKEEFCTSDYCSFKDLETCKKEIMKIVHFYNEERPHKSINNLTPNEAYLQKGPIKRKWKNYYKKKIEIIPMVRDCFYQKKKSCEGRQSQIFGCLLSKEI